MIDSNLYSFRVLKTKSAGVRICIQLIPLYNLKPFVLQVIYLHAFMRVLKKVYILNY